VPDDVNSKAELWIKCLIFKRKCRWGAVKIQNAAEYAGEYDAVIARLTAESPGKELADMFLFTDTVKAVSIIITPRFI